MRKLLADKKFKRFIREWTEQLELDEIELAPLNQELNYIEVALNPFSDEALEKCYICGRPFGNDKTNYDHVIPKSRKDLQKTVNNLVKTHQLCNSFKANRLPKIPK